LFYWASSGQAELDFVLKCEESIYPVEIKSGVSMKKKSLMIYSEKYQPNLAIRISPMNLKLDGAVLNCPVYLLGSLSRIIKKALVLR
jgi:uncharacterized protein